MVSTPQGAVIAPSGLMLSAAIIKDSRVGGGQKEASVILMEDHHRSEEYFQQEREDRNQRGKGPPNVDIFRKLWGLPTAVQILVPVCYPAAVGAQADAAGLPQNQVHFLFSTKAKCVFA